jgi:hypothetical protein
LKKPAESLEELRTGLRLVHGWRLAAERGASLPLIREFIRPAVRAVPSRMAHQLGVCGVSLVSSLGRPGLASQWIATDRGVEISLATAERDEHDVALEMLLCLGQALWERLLHSQRQAYWLLLVTEIRAGIAGEIDEQALRAKRALMANRVSAASGKRLERYGSASFAGTAAEYVHCLWHEVEVRSGPDYLPAPQLRRRLELLSRWFPPDRGYRLFAAIAPATSGGATSRTAEAAGTRTSRACHDSTRPETTFVSSVSAGVRKSVRRRAPGSRRQQRLPRRYWS